MPGSTQPVSPSFTPAGPVPGTVPLGRQREPSVSIDDFRPRRSVGPIIAAVVIGLSLVIGLVGYFGTRNLQTPQTTASPRPTDAPSRSGMPFESSYQKATGTWEITETAWEADQVRLTVRVTVETGGFTYLFYAYNNNGSRMLTPDSNSQLRSTRLRSGETAQGELIFRIPRGDATLVLADSSHHQLSGLPIRG